MYFKELYKKLVISAVIAATPLVLMAVLVMFFGVSFDQMIMFFGLVVNKNSIMLFAIIVFGFAMVMAASLGGILVVGVEEITVHYLDKKIKENSDRKGFYIRLKKTLVERNGTAI